MARIMNLDWLNPVYLPSKHRDSKDQMWIAQFIEFIGFDPNRLIKCLPLVEKSIEITNPRSDMDFSQKFLSMLYNLMLEFLVVAGSTPMYLLMEL